MNKQEIINEKIELLEDLCILPRNAHKQKEAIVDILKKCHSINEMERKLRVMYVNGMSAKEFIKQYGVN